MPPDPVVRGKQKPEHEMMFSRSCHSYKYRMDKDTLKFKSVRNVEDGIFQSSGLYRSRFQVVFMSGIFFVSGRVHPLYGKFVRHLPAVHPVADRVVGEEHGRQLLRVGFRLVVLRCFIGMAQGSLLVYGRMPFASLQRNGKLSSIIFSKVLIIVVFVVLLFP